MQRIATVGFLFLGLLTTPAFAQVIIGGNVSIGGTTLIGASTGTPTAATPVASPGAGTYSSAQSVTLTTSTSGATICYTTDGSTPTATVGTCTHGTTYSGAIFVSSSLTINAIASMSGYANSSLLTAVYTITSGSQVATPTFSIAAGAVSPGTTITASTTTSGATIFYTLDGTTPGYDSNYMPTGTTHIYGTAGTSGITAGNAFVPNFDVYGPLNIKLLAAKAGMTDSAVANASYTLTAATGTAISACQTFSAAGTYYLTADVSSTGTCFPITAKNVTLNLNSHTITYGTTASTVLSGTDLTTTSGSASISCTSCTFTSAMVGDRIYADNYNLGGYQNTGSSQGIPTVISTFTDAHDVVLNRSVGFTATGAEYFVATAPTPGVLIQVSGSSAGATEVYNGTITQSANASPDSHAISVPYGGGSDIFDSLTVNISQPEAEFVYMLYGTYGDEIRANTINDSVSAIYYRDGLPYPIYLGSALEASNTPEVIYDNTVNNSPQGGAVSDWVANIINNNFNGGPYQYVNGYCGFAEGPNTVIRGNSCTGNTRGYELENSNEVVQNNFSQLEDSTSVHDPNHAGTGCEQSGGFSIRQKDYGSQTGAPNATNNLIDSNEINATGGLCGATLDEFTILATGDTTTVSNNILTLDADQASPASPNAIWGLDGGPDAAGKPASWNGDASGLTYTNNTYSFSGAYASQVNSIYINYDGVANLTIPGLVSPLVRYRAGGTYSINSSATLTGTGSETLTCITGSTTFTGTYNGASIHCP